MTAQEIGRFGDYHLVGPTHMVQDKSQIIIQLADLVLGNAAVTVRTVLQVQFIRGIISFSLDWGWLVA
jgi:hypothetical protein